MHATIADAITDTAQNSIEAGATEISVAIVEDDGRITVEIADNGKGMDEETLKKVFNPFYTEAGKHDKRKVGLGLPILKQMCEACDGDVSIESVKGEGTTLRYHFAADHIDLPPMGELSAAAITLFNYPGNFELVFSHRVGSKNYSIAKSELIDAVGSLDCIDSIRLARDFISSQEQSLLPS